MRAILAFAEKRGLIGSAEVIWKEIVKRAASANPSFDSSEHDVFAGIVAAGLALPEPPAEDVAREVAALRALFGPRAVLTETANAAGMDR